MKFKIENIINKEMEFAICMYLLKLIISNNGYEKTTLTFNEDCSVVDVYVHFKPSIEYINVNCEIR